MSDADLYDDLIRDLRLAGNALQENSYEVEYSVSCDRVQGFSDNPETATQQFTEELRDADLVNVRISPQTILSLFEKPSLSDVEGGVNELLSLVEGRIWVDEIGKNSPYHPVHDVVIEYYPQLQGGEFEISWDTPDAKSYAQEFHDIFLDYDIDVRFHESFRE